MRTQQLLLHIMMFWELFKTINPKNVTLTPCMREEMLFSWTSVLLSPLCYEILHQTLNMFIFSYIHRSDAFDDSINRVSQQSREFGP